MMRLHLTPIFDLVRLMQCTIFGDVKVTQKFVRLARKEPQALIRGKLILRIEMNALPFSIICMFMILSGYIIPNLILV